MLLHRRLIADLLDALAGEKYPLGPAKLLQVEELLKTLLPDTPPEALRTLLAPLFATTPQEQSHFYELFDKHLALARAVLDEETEQPQNPVIAQAARSEQRWQRWALAALAATALLAGFIFDLAVQTSWLAPALLLPLAAFAGWKLLPQRRHFYIYLATLLLLTLAGLGFKYWLTPQAIAPDTENRPARYERFAIAPGETQTRDIKPAGDTAILRRVRYFYKNPPDTLILQPDSMGGAIAGEGRFSIDSAGVFLYTAGAGAQAGASDTIGVTAFYDNRRDSIFFIVDIKAEDTSPIEEINLPYPNTLPEIDPADLARADFYRRYQWPMKALLFLLLAFAAWALLMWIERRRARFVAEIEQRDQPPYAWQLQTGDQPDIVFDDNLGLLLNRLRRREGAPTHRLDVPPTIRATARSGGRASFVYRQQTRPPEYLLLIDRYDANDHRARLFDALYLEMQRAEVLVDRYFYHGDPRVCFNEAHPDGLPLTELLHRHRDARLLLVGEGRRLLTPSTGQAAPWTRLFSGWRSRALLLTNPTRQWGRKENTLAQLFHLAPASLQGLDLALEQFETLEQRPTADILRRSADAIAEPIAFEGSLMSSLRRYYPERLIQWIAACAVYPALHWDLTLYLGRELQGDTEAPLLSAANLRQLSRLPWFIEGRIPENARLQLVEYLAAQGLETPVRQALDRLLKQGPQPPEGSVAYDDYRMNVILNELLLNPSPERRKQLEREFERFLAAGKSPDFVAFKLLQRQPTALDLPAPESWKKYLFRHVLAWEDYINGLAPFWISIALLIVVAPLIPDVCSGGEIVKHKSKIYCLNSPKDHLTYLEYLTRDAIAVQDHQAVDSLRRTASQVARSATPTADTVPYYQNTSAYYHNYGARAYNDSRTAANPDSLRTLACDNFRRGNALYTAVSGGVGYHFYTAMRKACPTTTQRDTLAVPDFFVFTGRVYEAATGKPISGARVRAAGALNITDQLLETLSDEAFTARGGATATTDAEGRYSLRLTAAAVGAQLKLRATAAGYRDINQRARPAYPLPPIRLQPTTENRELTTAMVLVKGGTYEMGDVMGDKESDLEKVHTVTVGDFYLGAYELTFEEYDRFCEATGKEKPEDSGWGRGKRPAIYVRWFDAVEYCNWLSQLHGFKPVYTIIGQNVSADWSANGYRLPTEAEWEYAARALRGQGGGKVRFGNGKDIADPKEINFDGSEDYKKTYSVAGEYREKTTPVGNFAPNSLGLYDMSGNVFEWCWDWYDDYPSSPQTNPKGPDSGSNRVNRGGSWLNDPVLARCAYRRRYTPDYRVSYLGFRLARAAP